MNEPIQNSKDVAKNNSNKGGFTHAIFDVVEMFVISLCIVVLIFTFGIRLCNVDGPSMNNTLHDGEKILIYDFGYTPKAGDIVVFHKTDSPNPNLNKPIVKRVIATENQTVNIKIVSGDWTVTVDGKVIDEPYANFFEASLSEKHENKEINVKVPSGHVFVMGDNRYNSADSRDPAIGCVDERAILGKVFFRITPFNVFGVIN